MAKKDVTAVTLELMARSFKKAVVQKRKEIVNITLQIRERLRWALKGSQRNRRVLDGVVMPAIGAEKKSMRQRLWYNLIDVPIVSKPKYNKAKNPTKASITVITHYDGGDGGTPKVVNRAGLAYARLLNNDSRYARFNGYVQKLQQRFRSELQQRLK